MDLKDILVHVDASEAADTRLELAVALAKQHGAHLTGIHAKAEPFVPAMQDFTALPPSYFDDLERDAEETAQKALAKFEAIVGPAGISNDWRVVRGFTTDVLRHEAHCVDLVIVGQRNPDTPGASPELPDGVLLSAGCPVLVVPYGSRMPSFGTHVMIAWDDGAQAARAAHDAIPLLGHAEDVVVVSVNPGEVAEDAPLPGEELSRHLAHHGIKASPQSLIANDAGIADTLLARAADTGCDLFVMGAYGHGRLREMVLGGVTTHMLERMTVPVLMSH